MTGDRSTTRRSDFLVLTLAMSAAVFTGFTFTYFGPILSGTYQKVSPLDHLHGWSFFALGGMAFDLAREKRIHLAYTIGLPICVAVELAIFLSATASAGQLLARGLAWVGNTPGFLY